MTEPPTIPPARRLRGTLNVPPDKSISHRCALAALLGEGSATIGNYLAAEDTRATLRALGAFGARVERRREGPGSERVLVTGVGLRRAEEPADVVDARNSGTLARLMLGVAAGFGRFACFTGDGMLRRRPMGRVVGPLRAMGAVIEGASGSDRLPLAILGRGGRLRGGEHEIPVASAQVKGCLLLAGLFADGYGAVSEPDPSRDHTERLLAACGARVTSHETGGGGRLVRIEPVERLAVPPELRVPGDASSAAFWTAAAQVVPGSEVRVRAVGLNPTRTGFLEILRRMGADLEVSGVHENALGEPVGDVLSRHCGGLRGVRVGAADVPGAVDELPLLALVGAFAEGETVVEGAGELRVKETDRISAVCEEFRKVGVEIQEREDDFAVAGTGGIRGGRSSSRGDHRLAMCLAVAGLASREGVEVEGMKAASVSYPGFLDDLRSVAR